MPSFQSFISFIPMPKTEDAKRTLHLKDVPDDIYMFLLKEQNRIKEKKRISQYSLESTLYGIIRENDKFKRS